MTFHAFLFWKAFFLYCLVSSKKYKTFNKNLSNGKRNNDCYLKEKNSLFLCLLLYHFKTTNQFINPSSKFPTHSLPRSYVLQQLDECHRVG